MALLVVMAWGAGPAAAQVAPVPGAAPSLQQSDLRQAMLAAEDRRAATDVERAPLFVGLESQDPAIRARAVRALGRLEDAGLVPRIVRLAADPVPAVRAEAANALAQATVRSRSGVPAAREALVNLLRVERDGTVKSAAAASLGRLPCATEAEFRLTERALLSATRVPGPAAKVEPSHRVLGVDVTWGDRRMEDAPLPALLGAVRGFESLLRLRQKTVPSESTVARLRELAGWRMRPPANRPAAMESSVEPPSDANVRRLSLLALTAAGAADAATLNRAVMVDDDWQVRRLAVAAAAAGGEPMRPIVERGVTDPVPHVRIEAARAMGRLRSPASCKILITLSGDANLHVALAAIDALASCAAAAIPPPSAPSPGLPPPTAPSAPVQQAPSPAPGGPEVAALAEIVARMPATRAPDEAAAQDVTWHTPAHALVALARLAPEAALDYVPRFAGYPAWQARMYAARALAALAPADNNLSVAPSPESRGGKASALLESLAADRHPNVREAAIGALSQVRGHAADSIYIEALGAADYQLVMTAARALRQSPGRDRAVPALVASLDRISAERRETSRDPRRALLERLKELGSAEHARALEPYLNDSDPAIAALAAEVLSAWTGTAQAARTTRAPASGAPVAAEAEALAGSAAVVTMTGGGSFMLRLLPDEAPVTVLRFVRLARAGYYNGLTFHRVVPNFVIQGGSPGANEYMGDGPYLRDEVGLRSHARGTVGISTRGRDTGDAQIFVNLVDNPRLDHDYTVCAEIIDGMDVVDAIAEGAVIARVTIVAALPGGR